ncbi:recombinase family protein [Clostridiaceae bacterium]|nr:recombinase family protein [Clostridiaceae bacterium]RKI14394.1 recombinase family protein [bacterium 1XD21-70]
MVAMYLRKSRADKEAEARGEGETLSRHQDILAALAARMGLAVGAVYKELVSGETIAARPKMQQLLLEVMQGKWDSVLVMEIERLARGDTKDQGTVAEAFKFSGTKIITPAKTYDPSNEFDEEYFEFNLFMSRREYKTINRRIQTGRTAAFQDGWYIAGTAPYGYEKVKHKGDKGYVLEIVEDEASVVRMIFRLYTCGELQPDGSYQRFGSYQIRDRLNALHIPSRSGSSWSASSIMDIIRNPVYTGYQRWSWRKVHKTITNAGTIVESRPKDDGCPKIRGRFEPIITEEVYQMAQDVRKNKKTTHTGGSNALRNPLSGLVYCSGCHSLMTRQVSNTKAKYAILRCPNSKCKTVSSPIYLIEKKVIDGLREWAARYELEWEEEPQEDTSSALSLLSNSAKTLKAKRQQVRQQLSSTYDLLEQGVYTLSVFQERRKLLEEKQSGLDTELSRLLQQIEDIQLQEQAKREFLPAARRIIDSYWDTDDMETRNSMLKEVLDHIDYSRTERTKKGLRDTATFELHFYPRLPENR